MYNGIEINEGKLLANNIVFTLLLILLLAVCIFAFFVYRNNENSKSKDRFNRLKAKAYTDPEAKKQLEKLKRKLKKRKKGGILEKVLIISLLLVLVSVNLFVAVIPGWTDYIKKDYVVYSGDLSVEHGVHWLAKVGVKSYSIILEDGTALSGGSMLDEGKHTETIVYSRRTKIVVGIDK